MRILFGFLSIAFLAACNGSSSGDLTTGLASYAAKPANLRVNLTDAPIDDVQSVNVNIARVELILSGETESGRLPIAESFGMVDLLTLQNGVLLPMSDLAIPDSNIALHQIRLILEPDDNHLVKSDGSRCDLQTPSQQQTGIKVILPEPVFFDAGYSYSLVIDFDAKKSIVMQGNGGCLLKPTVKIKAFTRVISEDVGEDGGSSENPGEDLNNGEEPENTDQDGDGFEDEDDVTTLPIIDPDEDDDGELDWDLN